MHFPSSQHKRCCCISGLLTYTCCDANWQHWVLNQLIRCQREKTGRISGCGGPGLITIKLFANFVSLMLPQISATSQRRCLWYSWLLVAQICQTKAFLTSKRQKSPAPVKSHSRCILYLSSLPLDWLLPWSCMFTWGKVWYVTTYNIYKYLPQMHCSSSLQLLLRCL